VKVLITYLAENYREQLAAMRHPEIFSGLLLRHEQNMESKSARVAGAIGSLCGHRADVPLAFPDETEDDAYFNESGDEEEQIPLLEVDDRPFMARQPTGGVLEEKENQQEATRLAVDVVQPSMQGQPAVSSAPPLAHRSATPTIARSLLDTSDRSAADDDGERSNEVSALKRQRIGDVVAD